MFVRWKYRASTSEPDWQKRRGKLRPGRRGNPDGGSYAAYLVESIRAEGKPRQRVVAYLGSVARLGRDSWGKSPGSLTHQGAGEQATRYYFWTDARAKLDAIPMDAEMRAKCEERLAAVVPPLVGTELAAFETKRAAFLERSALRGGTAAAVESAL